MMNNILDGLDTVVQYIILYGPSIVAAITAISSIIVAIRKCGQIRDDASAGNKLLNKKLDNCTNYCTEVLKQNAALLKENTELKKKINHIWTGE